MIELLIIMATMLVVPIYHDMEQGCTTDEECMAYCPPPMDDPECDGGPEQDYPPER